MPLPDYKVNRILDRAKQVNDINRLVKYSEDLDQVYEEINQLQSKLFLADKAENPFFGDDVEEDSTDSSDLRLNLIDYIKSIHVSVKTPQQAVDKLVDLREHIESLPVMQISLPVPLDRFSDDFQEYLFYLIRDLFVGSRPYIMDREFDPSILGGLKIYWSGKYYDLSLQKQLKNYHSREKAYVSG